VNDTIMPTTMLPARERLRELLRAPDSHLDLAEAALCIAWEDRGIDSRTAALRELDTLAELVRPRLPSTATALDVIGALNRTLFSEYGLRGNTWNYNDPANSFLDQVLTTRAGLPITLSVIYLEVARRLELPIYGLGLPGHFLVRYTTPEGDLYIDPFNRGRLWTMAECQTQLAAFYGEITPEFIEQAMQPVLRRAILERMLRNLKSVYIEREQVAQALACTERILIIRPYAADEHRDRGLLLARLGVIGAALHALERYAELAPQAPDFTLIQQHARALAARISERQ
jgi:regulator of sirC expression with transglutaminase-like and TPR domain